MSIVESRSLRGSRVLPGHVGPAESATTEREFAAFLDSVHQGLRESGADQGAVDRHMDELFGGLQAYRRTGEDRWRSAVATCRAHALHGLIQQDPFTSRAFTKPRGYAGDAVML
ncbi:MAG TPA: hypothetical protein VF170_04960, partial [Planctomycetaceae bacterium]